MPTRWVRRCPLLPVYLHRLYRWPRCRSHRHSIFHASQCNRHLAHAPAPALHHHSQRAMRPSAPPPPPRLPHAANPRTVSSTMLIGQQRRPSPPPVPPSNPPGPLLRATRTAVLASPFTLPATAPFGSNTSRTRTMRTMTVCVLSLATLCTRSTGSRSRHLVSPRQIARRRCSD